MSIPDSEILHFDGEEILPMNYKETEHYRLTMQILLDPDIFFSNLEKTF
jgi:predicted ATPase